MKLMSILLLVGALHASAASWSQKVSFSGKNVSLEAAFSAIEKQTGYVLFYDYRQIAGAKLISLDVKDEPLLSFLNLCFKSQPFGYLIEDKTIIVTRNSEKHNRITAIVENVPLPPKDVSGIVSGDNGVLNGASVVIKRTGLVATTNTKGQFTISGVNENDTLIITYIGYQQEKVAVAGTNFVSVTLKIASGKLDEVQVLGYGGSTTRRLNTGSVTKVTADDIAKNPVGNVLQALAGRTAGMSISQANGLPGGDVTFQVRGQNSITANSYTSAPLVVVDGVPYPNAPINHPDMMGVTNNIPGPNGFGSSLYNLNPADIESIDILKDADATAIYGSRAANGVMLITTKKGKQGKTKVDANVNGGVAMNNRRVELLSTPEYRALRKEAYQNAGIVPTAANAPDLFTWDSTKTTDWQKELVGHTANIVDANLSMSGGAGGTSFLIAGNYHYENTIYADRRGSNKAGAHYSLNHTSNSGKFNIALSGMVNTTQTKLPNGAYGSLAYTLPPNFNPYDAAGNLNWSYSGGNPYGSMRTSYSAKTLSLTSNLLLRYTILPGLEARTSFGLTNVTSEQQLIFPKAALDPSNTFAQSYNRYNSSRNRTVNVEPQIQYSGNLLKGRFNILAGSTIMKTVGEMPVYITATGFSSDAYINNLALASTYTTGTGYNAYQYASFFGRANYIWNSRYIINGSFRRDGSSRFGPDRRFGNFGAIGAAWIFSNETFMKNIPFLSFGKLRGSIGWVGSDNVPNYKFISTYTATTYPYGTAAGMAPAQLDNPDFGWEATQKLEGAIELGFFKDRILLSASVYRNRTGNQLVDYPVSTQTGFTSFTNNLTSALVQNSGFEIELTTTNIQNTKLKWSTSLNLSLPRNKLLKFDGIEKTSYANSMVVGNPLLAYYALHYTGNNANGIPQYEDVNKNGVIDYSGGLAAYNKGDKVLVGAGYATCFGGLNNSISYKNIQLDFLFQYTLGAKKPTYLSNSFQTGQMYNVPKKTVEAYRSLGLAKAFIRPSFSTDWYNYTLLSDAVYMDASFLRLTNVSISYNFKPATLKQLHITGARVYLQAQNLFVITNYKGFDPETGINSVPPLQRLVGGLQFSL
ncbi:SusC/RagA family TonB-linked outer membrane protein [Filimonas effusa]|nr:SusC/RagA family TonB-linked outer membrane protein [Filimonas effusa]